MKFLKNKKVVAIIGIIICIIMCFLIDYIVSNYGGEGIITENKMDEAENAKKENFMEEMDNERTNGKKSNTEDSGWENEEVDKNINDNVEEEEYVNKIEQENVNSAEAIEVEKKIFVYVTGEVNNAGVVTLNEGSRITDAITAAGGITSKANVSKINLVFVLEDGMKINIPNDNDLKNNPNFEYVTMGSGDGIVNYDGGTYNRNDGLAEPENRYSTTIDFVNINTATQTELETLPGIGPSLALKIITYRKENGKFSNIEEIKNVSGIGDSKFNDIKKYIVV